MKKLISSIAIVCLVGMMVVVAVKAAVTSDVSATVTVQNISVSVTSGEVAYGVLALSGTKDTTTGGVDNTQTATNDGNVNENFGIRGFDTSTGCTWTISNTAIGNETYMHKYCNTGSGTPDPCDAGPTWTTVGVGSYTNFASTVIPSGTAKFDLQILVPSSTTCTTQATVTVTVQASAS